MTFVGQEHSRCNRITDELLRSLSELRLQLQSEKDGSSDLEDRIYELEANHESPA